MRVTKSTVTSTGQTLDWVPIESQVQRSVASPPPNTSSRRVGADPARPTQKLEFDLSEPGPAGHVPVLRPNVSRFRDLDELQKVLSKRGGLRVNINRANKKVSDPDPAGYFHALSSRNVQAYGCDARLGMWDPKIDLPSSPGDDHSISQTWLQNYQTPQTHSIEAGWTVDSGLNGDVFTHLFTFYTTNGYASEGDLLGSYNQIYKGWVQYSQTLYPGIRLLPVSVLSGTQIDLGIKFQLYQGNWWFGLSATASDPWTWIGYYPATLFPGGLANYAQWIGFGGEVYSALANPCSTADQMGSGIQASAGYGRSAYQRNIHTQSDTDGTVVNFDGVPSVDAAASNCPIDPYTIICFMNSGSLWGSYQFYGGPTNSPFVRIPTEGIWQWVDYGTMVDDGIHPWNPDFRYLLTGIVLADLAKYSSPTITKQLLALAASQIESAAKGIVTQINDFSDELEDQG